MLLVSILLLQAFRYASLFSRAHIPPLELRPPLYVLPACILLRMVRRCVPVFPPAIMQARLWVQRVISCARLVNILESGQLFVPLLQQDITRLQMALVLLLLALQERTLQPVVSQPVQVCQRAHIQSQALRLAQLDSLLARLERIPRLFRLLRAPSSLPGLTLSL